MSAIVLKETEAAFQGAVIELARALGWRCYHTHDSRRSAHGWPDLVLVRGDRILFRELKSSSGHVSRAQREWLDALKGAGADVAVLRPADWPVIEAELR